MKLNMLWELKINSVEAYAWAGVAFGSMVFLIATFWDNIAGIQIRHHQGYGWQQILVMAASGLFAFWGVCVARNWGE